MTSARVSTCIVGGGPAGLMLGLGAGAKVAQMGPSRTSPAWAEGPLTLP